jgi:AcrR family transcriptional regulator
LTQKRKTGRPTKTPGQKTTPEKIIDAAIDLFAQKGYNNISIRNIAAAVGIKESSIYKHYASKNQILQKILQYPLTRIYTIAERDDTTEQLITKMGVDGFLSESGTVFTNWITDPTTVKVLRIFYIELYHNDQIMQSYVNLVNQGEMFWASVFNKMMKQGLIKPADPQMLASEFLAVFWTAFTDYFLVQYGRTSGSFMDLHSASLARHTEYFLKTVGESK